MADRFSDEYAHLLDVLEARIMGNMHVGFAASVTRYDAAKQLVDVQPLVADYFQADGEDVEQVYSPVLPNLPVLFPAGGGYRVTFPIQVGDVVEVLIQDRSHDAWQDQGGRQTPVDLRRHHLSDAVAIPGLHDNKHPWAGAATDHMTLGKDGGPLLRLKNSTIELGSTATQSAVQGDALATAIHTLVSAIQAAASLTVPGSITGGAAAAWASAASACTAFNAVNFLSSTVKVQP
jgi:hypothetical protein